jgi:hypothetical protein
MRLGTKHHTYMSTLLKVVYSLIYYEKLAASLIEKMSLSISIKQHNTIIIHYRFT